MRSTATQLARQPPHGDVPPPSTHRSHDWRYQWRADGWNADPRAAPGIGPAPVLDSGSAGHCSSAVTALLVATWKHLTHDDPDKTRLDLPPAPALAFGCIDNLYCKWSPAVMKANGHHHTILRGANGDNLVRTTGWGTPCLPPGPLHHHLADSVRRDRRERDRRDQFGGCVTLGRA